MYRVLKLSGVGVCLWCTEASAALWQSTNWAVIGAASGGIGYDSNLSVSPDDEQDAFVFLDPSVTLKRHGASTTLDVSATASFTKFVNNRSDAQADGSFSAAYSYPSGYDGVPKLYGNAGWRRTTSANGSVGRRLTSQTAAVYGGGRVYASGKLGLDVDLAHSWLKYSEDQFNQSHRTAFTASLAYHPRPNLQYSLKSITGYAKSSPNGVGDDVTSWEQGVAVQAKGEITAKITSSVYLGAAAVRYRGAFRRSDVLPMAGGDVVWQVTPRGFVRGGVELGVDYSPEGESMKFQRVTLSYFQRLYGEWVGEVRLVPTRSTYHREVRTREDETIGWGSSLNYEPSQRFSASLSYDYTNQDSDRRFLKFQRHLVVLRSSYKF